MTNREIELILRLRDQATAVWNRFEGGIRGGAKRMGSFLAQNWGTMLAGAVGAFYVVSQAFEKVERLAKKVGKALSSETGGSAKNAANQIKELSSTLETIKTIADQALIRVGLAALGIGKSVAVFFASVVFISTKGLALIEEGLNAMGLSSSKFFQNLNANAGKLAMQMSKEAMDAFKAAFASSKDLGLGFEGLREKVERLKKELDEMDPTTAEYIKKYREWKLAADELAKAEEHAALMAMQGHKLRGPAVKMQLTDMQKLIRTAALYTQQLEFMGKYGPGNKQVMKMVGDFKEVSIEVPEAFDENWRTVLNEVSYAGSRAASDFYDFFSGNIQGVNGLVKELTRSIADHFKQMVAQLAAQAIFAQILGLIFPSIGFAGFAKQGGGILGMLANKTTSPGSGASSLPSLLAPAQKANSVTVNFNTPVPNAQWVVESVREAVQQTGLPVEKLIVNNRARVVLNPS